MTKKLYIDTTVKSLYRYLEDIKTGILQVPSFQRDFVWRRDDIKDLFDSIKNGYPIGSILLWQPNLVIGKNKETVGGFYIPNNEDNPIYILDGYQRLSCLFGCLMNPAKIGLGYNEKERKEFFDLYYDLEDESFLYQRSGTKRVPWQLPMHILMSSSDFRHYARTEMESILDLNKLEIYLDRADRLSNTLLDYKIASIEIKNANIEEAVDIFSRINSKGMDISYDWMVNALSNTSDFQFGKEIDDLLEDLRIYNFDKIKRNTIFRCIQSSFGKLYIDQTNIEELAKREDFASITLESLPYIKEAVRFLYEELLVLDAKLLPYNIQLIFIMDFFKKKKNPTQEDLEELKKWFWITSYSNYFTLYSLSNQRNAYYHFHSYLDGSEKNPIYNDKPNLNFEVAQFPDKITMGSVRSKALILYMLNYSLEFKSVSADSVTGYSIQKLFPYLNDAANFLPIIEQFNNKINKRKNLSERFKEDFLVDTLSQYFVTEEMRNMYVNRGNPVEVICARKNMIQQHEKKFVDGLGCLEYNIEESLPYP